MRVYLTVRRLVAHSCAVHCQSYRHERASTPCLIGNALAKIGQRSGRSWSKCPATDGRSPIFVSSATAYNSLEAPQGLEAACNIAMYIKDRTQMVHVQSSTRAQLIEMPSYRRSRLSGWNLAGNHASVQNLKGIALPVHRHITTQNRYYKRFIAKYTLGRSNLHLSIAGASAIPISSRAID